MHVHVCTYGSVNQELTILHWVQYNHSHYNHVLQPAKGKKKKADKDRRKYFESDSEEENVPNNVEVDTEEENITPQETKVENVYISDEELIDKEKDISGKHIYVELCFVIRLAFSPGQRVMFCLSNT